MLNAHNVFNINDNFTIDELKNAYITKYNQIETNESLSQFDKSSLKNTYHNYYKYYKKLRENHPIVNTSQSDEFSTYFNRYYDILNDMHKLLNDKINDLDNINTHSSNYKQKIIDENGIETVYEIIENKNNNKLTCDKKAYKLYPNGYIEPIRFDIDL